MKVLREYIGSHHYLDTYSKTKLHCPTCGKPGVWMEEGPGDYYQGSDYICSACGTGHKLDFNRLLKEDWELGVLRQLRSGIMESPSTRRGN